MGPKFGPFLGTGTGTKKISFGHFYLYKRILTPRVYTICILETTGRQSVKGQGQVTDYLFIFYKKIYIRSFDAEFRGEFSGAHHFDPRGSDPCQICHFLVKSSKNGDHSMIYDFHAKFCDRFNGVNHF